MTDTTPIPETTTRRRTKRRYAHELFPAGDEWEIRPLAVEVPHLYARMIGMDVWGTGWFDAEPSEMASRTMHLIAAVEKALIADALLQGLSGEKAWKWAEERAADEAHEIAYERAERYGVDLDQIKPYPCGPDPQTHDHLGRLNRQGFQPVTRVAGREEDCEACTEPDPTPETTEERQRARIRTLATPEAVDEYFAETGIETAVVRDAGTALYLISGNEDGPFFVGVPLEANEEGTEFDSNTGSILRPTVGEFVPSYPLYVLATGNSTSGVQPKAAAS